MAAVKARGDVIALISGKQIKLHDFSKGKSCILDLPETSDKARNNNNTAGGEDDDKNSNQNEKSNQQQQGKESSANLDSGPNRTLSAAFSGSGQLLAVTDDHKQLHLYQKSNDEATTTPWTLLTSRSVVRRSTSVLFTCDEKDVILGDKSGDVYKFSVIEPTNPGKLMMGHLSMLLDMVLADSDRYLITCDRDEKIRVSLFPNAYNIHCYCLGHTDFLSRLMYVPEVKAIISGGGDGTIRSWNLEGKNLHCLSHGVSLLNENKEEKNKGVSNPDSSTASNNNNGTSSSDTAAVKCMAFDPCSKTLAVSFDQSRTLQLYKIKTVNDQQCFEIKLCDERQLPSEPWDVQFLTKSQLLVLSPLQDSPVQLFDCSTSSTEESSVGPKITNVSQKYLQQHPKTQEFLKTVNSDWAFFEPSVKIDSLISSLPKSRIDNMPDYQERKEQQAKKKFQPKGKRKNQEDCKKGANSCQSPEGGQEPSAKAVKAD